MNGTFISMGGEVFFIAQDIKSYYRYDGKTLEYQPIESGLQNNGLVGDLPPSNDQWQEVDEDLVGDEKVFWDGEETELKLMYEFIKTELENTKN